MTSAEIQYLIDSGQQSIQIPPGIHELDDTVLTRERAITLTGVYGHSILAPKKPGMTLLHVTSQGACTLRDMFFNSLGNPEITGVKIGTASTSNAGSMVEHCAFGDMRRCIDGASVDVLKVVDTRFICFAPTGATAIAIGNELEGDIWGGRIVDCDFLGPWEHGILSHGHGLSLRGCGFNGPVYHFKFEGWSRVVDVSNGAVTLVSGPGFQAHWAGKTVQVEGRFCSVLSVESVSEMTVNDSFSGGGQRMCFATTGQISISECGFDGGEYNYTGIDMTGPNTFYGVRIRGNRFSNWNRHTEHNACLVNMPQVSEVSFNGNNCQSGVPDGDSYGFRAIDCLDANITGNDFTGYNVAVMCGRSVASKSVYSLGVNAYISCKTRVKWAGGALADG